MNICKDTKHYSERNKGVGWMASLNNPSIQVSIYIPLNDLKWDGFRCFLIEMKWQPTSSPNSSTAQISVSSFRKTLYTCERIKRMRNKTVKIACQHFDTYTKNSNVCNLPP